MRPAHTPVNMPATAAAAAPAGRRLRPSATTVTLLCLLPVMHLAGALGLYSWELGNLSWDVLVHISNGFLGTLLFAAVLHDLNARATSTQAATVPGSSVASGACQASTARGQPRGAWRERAWGVAKVTALLLLSTSLIEVVEAAGGQVAGHAGAQVQPCGSETV